MLRKFCFGLMTIAILCIGSVVALGEDTVLARVRFAPGTDEGSLPMLMLSDEEILQLVRASTGADILLPKGYTQRGEVEVNKQRNGALTDAQADLMRAFASCNVQDSWTDAEGYDVRLYEAPVSAFEGLTNVRMFYDADAQAGTVGLSVKVARAADADQWVVGGVKGGEGVPVEPVEVSEGMVGFRQTMGESGSPLVLTMAVSQADAEALLDPTRADETVVTYQFFSDEKDAATAAALAAALAP